MTKDIYNEMLKKLSDTLKNTSIDTSDKNKPKYMTKCKKPVVNVDKFKNDFTKNMSLTEVPKSCDALYMVSQDQFFLIEFKNGIIDAKKNYEINRKIFESLLLLSEKFSETINFMRKNMYFILVYNENVKHGKKQYEDTNLNEIQMSLLKLANERIIRFGLNHFKKLYFKEVYTYTKAEFESKFVSKYCTGYFTV